MPYKIPYNYQPDLEASIYGMSSLSSTTYKSATVPT